MLASISCLSNIFGAHFAVANKNHNINTQTQKWLDYKTPYDEL